MSIYVGVKLENRLSVALLKKSILDFMNIIYKHIFLKFGVISFRNKQMV